MFYSATCFYTLCLMQNPLLVLPAANDHLIYLSVTTVQAPLSHPHEKMDGGE